MNSLKSKKTHNPENESGTKEKEKNHLLKYQALLVEIKRRDTRRFMPSAGSPTLRIGTEKLFSDLSGQDDNF